MATHCENLDCKKKLGTFYYVLELVVGIERQEPTILCSTECVRVITHKVDAARSMVENLSGVLGRG